MDTSFSKYWLLPFLVCVITWWKNTSSSRDDTRLEASSKDRDCDRQTWIQTNSKLLYVIVLLRSQRGWDVRCQESRSASHQVTSGWDIFVVRHQQQRQQDTRSMSRWKLHGNKSMPSNTASVLSCCQMLPVDLYGEVNYTQNSSGVRLYKVIKRRVGLYQCQYPPCYGKTNMFTLPSEPCCEGENNNSEMDRTQADRVGVGNHIKAQTRYLRLQGPAKFPSLFPYWPPLQCEIHAYLCFNM